MKKKGKAEKSNNFDIKFHCSFNYQEYLIKFISTLNSYSTFMNINQKCDLNKLLVVVCVKVYLLGWWNDHYLHILFNDV